MRPPATPAPTPVRPALLALLGLGGLVPVGIATKLYTGPGASWVNDSAGGIVYVVFWCLAVGLLARRAPAGRIAAAVTATTGLLEFAQLWHPAVLERLRSTLPGRWLLGTTFAWNDFPYYLLGGLLGWAWLAMLRGRDTRRRNPPAPIS